MHWWLAAALPPAAVETRSRQRLNERLAGKASSRCTGSFPSSIPPLAARLHLREKRILRALESTMKPARPSLNTTPKGKLLPPRHDAVYIGLTLKTAPTLRALIDARVDAMPLRVWWRKYAHYCPLAFLPRPPPSGHRLQRTARRFARRKKPAEATEEIKLRSRQYAKRQLTWLRRNKAIHWIFWKKERGFSPRPSAFDRNPLRPWIRDKPDGRGTRTRTSPVHRKGPLRQKETERYAKKHPSIFRTPFWPKPAAPVPWSPFF